MELPAVVAVAELVVVANVVAVAAGVEDAEDCRWVRRPCRRRGCQCVQLGRGSSGSLRIFQVGPQHIDARRLI